MFTSKCSFPKYLTTTRKSFFCSSLWKIRWIHFTNPVSESLLNIKCNYRIKIDEKKMLKTCRKIDRHEDEEGFPVVFTERKKQLQKSVLFLQCFKNDIMPGTFTETVNTVTITRCFQYCDSYRFIDTYSEWKGINTTKSPSVEQTRNILFAQKCYGTSLTGRVITDSHHVQVQDINANATLSTCRTDEKWPFSIFLCFFFFFFNFTFLRPFAGCLTIDLLFSIFDRSQQHLPSYHIHYLSKSFLRYICAT